MRLIPARPAPVRSTDTPNGQRRHRRRGGAATAWRMRLSPDTQLVQERASRSVKRVAIAVATAITMLAASAPAAQSAPDTGGRGAPLAAASSGTVPLIKSEPLAKRGPSSQGGPFIGPSPTPVAVAELKDQRTAKSRVFRNDDGSLTVQESSTPVNHQLADGSWVPIDNALHPDSSRPGWVTTNGNDWKAAFGPSSEGFELATAAGVVGVAFDGQQSSASSAPEVESSGAPDAGGTAREIAAQGPQATAAKVLYRNALRGTDLRYTVDASGVKEEIVLANRTAPTEFPFKVTGANLGLMNSGGVSLSGDLGKLFSIPAPTVEAADGSDVTKLSGAHYEIHDRNGPEPGAQLAVVIDQAWLRRQAASAFPLVIDPTLWWLAPQSAVSWSNQGDFYPGPSIKIGHDSTGRDWRAALYFNDYESYLNSNYRVQQAELEFQTSSGPHDLPSISLFDLSGQPSSYAQIGGTQIPPYVLDNYHLAAAQAFDSWVTHNQTNHWVGVRTSQPGTVPSVYGPVTLNLVIYPSAAPSFVTNLTDDQVLSTTTPLLQAQPVPANQDGYPAGYAFEITTNPQPRSGTVVIMGPDPGTSPPSWKVTPGALREGITYYAWVWTGWTAIEDLWPPTPTVARRFTIKLGLGEGGTAPTDEVGSVPGSSSTPSEGAPSPSLPSAKLTTNLVNGNLSLTLGTKSMGTLSGGISPAFTYNSLTTDSHGLRLEFYGDRNGNGVIDEGVDQPWGERTAAGFNSDYLWPEYLDADKALARWTGYLTLPAGTWQLGAISSDGLKITSGASVLLDRWASHEPEASPAFGTAFTATADMPIKIDWYNGSGAAVAHVVAKDSNGRTYELPPDWLSRGPRALPLGWTLNADTASARWIGLENHGTSVALLAADGSAYEFKAASNGVYTPPPDDPTDLLTSSPTGQFVLQSADGQTYTFRTDGQLESLVSAADSTNPAALEYGYSGTPLRLRTIRDRVTNRTVNLAYGGDAECGTVPAASNGLLCQIAYWDGTVSTLTYSSVGQLIRFTHPGNLIYDLAYNADGLLKSLRDPLAYNAVAAGVRTDDATVLTEISYANGRVSTVTQPAPLAGAARPQRTYTYSAGEGQVAVAGFTPPSGFTQRVRYDSRNRITEDADAAGLTTTYGWDDKDRPISTIDPAGLETTTQYDLHGRPTDTYGPAPGSCFTTPAAGQTPVPNGTCTSQAVPHATKAYDEGIHGLAATYWTNPNLAGPAGLPATGLGTGGDMYKDWNTTLPVIPGPGGWSARYSGDVNITAADTYTWQVQTRGSLARVWVDNTLVADNTQAEPATGWTSSTGTAQTVTTGIHSIRVDMVDTTGPAGLQVLWSRTGAATFVTVPGSVLSPNYGLATTATDADGKVTTTEYSDPTAGIGPEYRLPTATVQDPGSSPHLNLRTVTTYEAPGTGSYFRRLAKTLPAAAGNPCAPGSNPCTTFTNYGGTDGPIGASGGAISLRASTAGGNSVTSSVTVNKPTGVASGDVVIAGIAARGGSDVVINPPTGWTLMRTDNNSNSLQLSSYWHLAGSSEPASYTWNLTDATSGAAASKAAAGTVTAYTGVNTATPVDAFGGQVDPNSTLSIVAPSITTTVANDRVVGLFTIANASNIDPPSGSSAMTELSEANSNVSGQAHVDVEAADTTQASSGVTGTRTASGSGTAARTNGQLISLRPAGSGPCGVTAATPEGGKPKRITDPDPDGAGPQVARAEDFVYDAVGREVGHRVGTTATIDTAAWSCTNYDPQGRLLTESWPATATAPARTVTYTYSLGGNPLINAVSDTLWGSAGVMATVDLLGRVVSYSDIYGDTTSTQYDQAGRVINVNGPDGNRAQNYTAEGRPGSVVVDGTTMATPAYDPSTGRLSSVTYANGTTTTLGYDTLGRSKSTSTVNGSSTTINGDQVTYSTGSRVNDEQVYTGSGYVDANASGDNYLYDAAGRLTSAQVPGTTYAYAYGTSSSCTAPDAGKNTNRSTLTVTGTGAGTTSYCYDQADRLVSSTNYAAGTVVYDNHGNTTQLGSENLDFDASDRHVRTETPTTLTRYLRDPLNRVVDRVDMTRTTFVASTSATAVGASVAVSRPTGTQAGDLIVAGVTMANAGTLSASGWTVAASQTQGTQVTWMLWRYATSGDPASWTISATLATQVTAALATYRGPTALAPIAVTGSATTTAGTNHPLPQVTTTSDANQLVHVVGFGANIAPTAPPGSQRAVQAGAVSLLLADHYQSEPGQNPAANATTTTAVNSASLTVAIVPASTDRHLGYADRSDNASHLDDSAGALIERYYGLAGGVTVTESAPAQQQVFSDDFAGTTGANWNSSKWATTSNDSTKKVDIQSNQGELYINGASTRATAQMTAIADSEATFSYRFSDRNSASFLRIYLRASGATGSNQMPNAYRLEIASDSSTISLQKFVNSVVTQIGSFTYTKDTNAQRVRFRVQGSTIEAKVWADATPEPGNWSVLATDTAITGTGVVQIAHSYTSGARSVYLDDVVVTIPTTPARTWSYSNIHGDVTATANSSGTRTWIGWYGPYGENPSGSNPANGTAPGTDWGWHGQQGRMSDRDLIQMGARPYAPSLGRFLAVDPIEGGCANHYAYVYGDPVNQADLNGKDFSLSNPFKGSWVDGLTNFIQEGIADAFGGACDNHVVRFVTGTFGVTSAGNLAILGGTNYINSVLGALGERGAWAAVMAGKVGRGVKVLNIVAITSTVAEISCDISGHPAPFGG
jgi:RHS repeat-associated protein